MIEERQVGDDFFNAYAEKIKNDEKKSSSNGNSGNSFQYDEIQYVGLEKGIFGLFRFIGLPVGSEAMGYTRECYDPKEIIQLELKDDKNKKFNVNLPLHTANKRDDHILFRLYDAVTESVKIGDDWVPKYKDKYPELYELVTKGGFKKEEGKPYTYANGLKGTQVTIYNVIDRSDDWCAKNKHTKILCRDLNIDDQNRVWPKPGVKSFAFKGLGKLISKYGFADKYDVAVKRTGIQDNPFLIYNASRLKEKDMLEDLENDDGCPKFDISKVVLGPLTQEERTYDAYDLDKYYSPTKYTKIYERFGKVFELCDLDLGTHFTEEIKGYIEKEKAEAAARKAAHEAEAASTENKAINEALDKIEAEAEAPTIESPVDDVYSAPKAEPSFDTMKEVDPTADVSMTSDSVPTRSRSAAKTEAAVIDTSLLKGYNNLSDELKSRIVDVKNIDGKVEIVWDRKDDLLRCDTCGALSPESATHCPVCGVKF